MTKPVILTGDRTTGPLHIGHYAGSLRNWLRFQADHDQFLPTVLRSHFGILEICPTEIDQRFVFVQARTPKQRQTGIAAYSLMRSL